MTAIFQAAVTDSCVAILTQAGTYGFICVILHLPFLISVTQLTRISVSIVAGGGKKHIQEVQTDMTLLLGGIDIVLSL